MKRNLILVVWATILGTALFSCKKSDRTNPAISPETGYWFGTFTLAGAAVPTGNEGHLLKSNGTLVVYDFFGQQSTDTASCQIKGYGTYTVSGNTVTQQYSFGNGQNFNATCTVNGNTMAGPYSGSGSGTLSLTKQ